MSIHHEKAIKSINEIKRLVKYLEDNVSLNLPTQLFESVSHAIGDHSEKLKEASIDEQYIWEHMKAFGSFPKEK